MALEKKNENIDEQMDDPGGQSLDVNKYLLSLWPIDASSIIKSMIVPEKSIVFTFSYIKA